MLKKAALIWGVLFVLIGIAGFIPGLTTEDSMGMKLLLGLFMVDGVHNVVHLLTGVASLAASKSTTLSRLYFQTFGIVYGLVTIIGFAIGSGHYVLGLIPVNTADNFLHLGITLVTLYLGFGYKPKQAVATITP
jgi:hypothetical protein